MLFVLGQGLSQPSQHAVRCSLALLSGGSDYRMTHTLTAILGPEIILVFTFSTIFNKLRELFNALLENRFCVRWLSLNVG